MNKMSIENSIWIHSNPETVWEALINSNKLQNWWGDSTYPRITKLALNEKIYFSDDDKSIFATLISVDIYKEFAFYWPPHPAYFSVPITTRYKLIQEKDGIRVILTEEGFEAMPEEIRQTRHDQISSEYVKVLQNLKSYVEKS